MRLGTMWRQFQDAPFPHRPVNRDLAPLYDALLETEASLARAIESLIAGDPVGRDEIEFPSALLEELARLERSHHPGAREAAAYVAHLNDLKPLVVYARTLLN